MANTKFGKKIKEEKMMRIQETAVVNETQDGLVIVICGYI